MHDVQRRSHVVHEHLHGAQADASAVGPPCHEHRDQQREADVEDDEERRVDRGAGARPWCQPLERGAGGEDAGADEAQRCGGQRAADANQHTRHDDEEDVEPGDGRVDASGDPRALRDDPGEPDHEDPARQHRAPGAADRVQNGDEGSHRGNGGDAPGERIRLHEHGDPRQR